MSQVIGEDPHPRALLFQVDRKHLAAIARCFPVSAQIEHRHSVAMGEWDLVVSEGEVPKWLADHLYVITFGRGPFLPPDEDYETTMGGARMLGRWIQFPGRALEIPDGLPPSVAELVRTHMAPAAQAAARNEGGNSVIVEGRSADQHGDPVAVSATLSTRRKMATHRGGPRRRKNSSGL